MMSFVALQETLRKELRKRIDAGELTGMELARRTGFTQAHISNFLNRKRGLKLSALDRMLKAIGLSLYGLLNPHELVRFAAVPVSADVEYADVPLVEGPAAAASEVIVNEEVKDLHKYRRSFLNRLRTDLVSPARKSWTRYVLVRADAQDGASMWPRLGPGSLALVDRHYHSLRPYRKSERNLYAVRRAEGVVLRYVELSGSSLVLRPHNPDQPVEVLPIEEGKNAADLIIGRVAHISVET
jgi:transcriptional regulator with XRE-family HTH domain